MEGQLKQSCKKWFFTGNPSLWFVLGYILMMGLIILLFFERFNFEGSNLFTLMWTYLTLIIVYSIINFKRYHLFWINNQKSEIAKSYLHATSQYTPYLLIAVVYEHIFIYRDVFSDQFQLIDLTLMKIDELILGVQPTIWLEKFLHPLAVDYFMVAYALFLVYPYVYLVYLYQKNQLLVFHKAMLAQVFSLFVALTLFVTLPAKGPRYTFSVNNDDSNMGGLAQTLPSYNQPLQGINNDFIMDLTGKPSLFQFQYDLWNQIERVKTDCMPSMHTCLCLIVLIYAVRYRNLFKWKKLSMIFWIVGNGSLFFSTVYLRYHWVIDVIAGAVLAVAVYYLTEYFYSWWLRRRADCGLGSPSVPWLNKAAELNERKINGYLVQPHN